jgi:hypothetical protein
MITLCLWNWNCQWEQEYQDALGLGGMKSQTWLVLASVCDPTELYYKLGGVNCASEFGLYETLGLF